MPRDPSNVDPTSNDASADKPPLPAGQSWESIPVDPMPEGLSRPSTRRKRGVVGIIIRDQRLCIIRRSLTVTAPGCLCLPGGGIEKGETEAEALVREMQEELAIDVQPVRLCWRSVTSWGTNLAWWLADLDEAVDPVANPDEVADVFWMTPDEIRCADGMLPSLPAFMDAWDRGDVDLQIG